MVTELSQNISKSSLFASFSLIATFLGFTVDSIAIISILAAIQTNNDVPNFISPTLAFWILVIANFSYIGYLHAYWNKNQQSYSESFTKLALPDLPG